MYGYRAVLEMGDMVKAVGEKRAHVATIYLGRGVSSLFAGLTQESYSHGWELKT
jgi:hypothetical protein